MALPTLDISKSLVPANVLGSYDQLKEECQNLIKASKQGYSDDRCSINLPVDKKIARESLALAKKHRRVDAIVVVGIGGSDLGTIAVQEAMLGKYYNQRLGKPLVFFSDTVDSKSMKDLGLIITGLLKKKKTVIINGVSKSGRTTETIANFEVLVALLKKYDKKWNKHVVVTTDEGSVFWDLAKKEGFETLCLPKKVGGRYSVLSAVGQYPLRVLGIDVDSLLKGATDMRKICLIGDILKNPAMQRAAMIHYHYNQGRNIADMFLFSSELESVGKWYRQLMGESLGKEWDSTGKERVWAGMTPTVSVGSTDLHSMAQLYLGGPQDEFTTFVSVENGPVVKVPNLAGYDKLVPDIQNKELKEIMDSILYGVMTAFEKGKRPFCKITLKELSEYQIGALMQLHMIEMMYLGRLMGVNPFDQPNVEAYKVETKRILSKGRN